MPAAMTRAPRGTVAPVVCAACATVMFTSRTAAADEPPTPRVWYGAPAFIADAVSLSVVSWTAFEGFPGVNYQTNQGLETALFTTFWPLAGAAYLGVAPVMHGLHHHGVRAAASAGMRLAAPFVGGVLGTIVAIAATPSTESAGTGPSDAWAAGLLVGFWSGAVAAALVDDLVLAWDDVPVDSAPPAAPGTTIAVVPHVAWAGDHERGARGTLDLVGRF